MSNELRDETSRTLERGVAQSGVRLANERAVFALIALNPGASNADLARMSGLGPQTTSRIVADLESRDMVVRGKVLRGKRGQPATPLFLNSEAAYCFGVEIGWRHVEVLLIEMSGKVLVATRRCFDYVDATTIFTEVADAIANMQANMSPRQLERLVGIGLASPSSIELNIVNVGGPPEQVDLWKDIDVAQRLQQETGLETSWLNDGGAACWGELIAQPRPRPMAFAYFQISVFVGAGIVVNREIWTGVNGDAANLGAIMVSDSNGQPSYMFNLASLLALETRLKQGGLPVPTGCALEWDWSAIEPVASQWIEEAGLALAQAVLTTRAFIDIELAMFDGPIPPAILDRIFERIEHYLAILPKSSLNPPRIGKGKLGASAAATGVAQRVLFDRFFSRAWTLFST